jgi:hypothetical protein
VPVVECHGEGLPRESASKPAAFPSSQTLIRHRESRPFDPALHAVQQAIASEPFTSTRVLLTLALLLAVVVSGCGTSTPPSALAKQAAAVQSLAAEGALLAGDAADGRATGVYRREHSSELAAAASKAATALDRAKTTPALEPRLRRLHRIAVRVSAQLKHLEGASKAGARAVERELQAAADSSEKLGEGLA